MDSIVDDVDEPERKTTRLTKTTTALAEDEEDEGVGGRMIPLLW
jgi:hypothetical protein